MKVWEILPKILFLSLFLLILSGAGYVGTLPDLGIDNNTELPKPPEVENNDILPLDKLTIPTKYKKSVVEETPYVMHHKDTAEMIRLMENLSKTISYDNSIKKFVANSNMLDWYVKNYNLKYPDETYTQQRELLNVISEDTLKMKDYWLYCEKNREYILNYDTSGYYSPEYLEFIKKEYQKHIDSAIQDLKLMD